MTKPRDLANSVNASSIPTARLQDDAVTNAKLAFDGGPLSGFRNLLINGNPIVNQRGYVSGTNTGGANEYTLDRWRVVTSGQNITFSTTAGICTVTAPAGGVEQVVEGASILGGSYVLSWTGTATATIGGNAVTNGGTVTLTGGSNATVRFTGGTFSKAQLEPGTVATAFEHRPLQVELALCQRYYWQSATSTNHFGLQGYNTAGNNISQTVLFPVEMRVAPTVTFGAESTTNTTGLSANAIYKGGYLLLATATATGFTAATLNASFVKHDAEL